MRGTRALTRFAALVLAAALASPAQADLLQLKDGRFIEGVPLRREGGDIVLRYAAGEVRVPAAMVEDASIDGEAPPAPASAEEEEKRASGLVRYRGKWVKPEAREKALREDLARRKAELEEVRAHAEWRNRWKWESKNFRFESTLPPRLNEEYAALLETYFEEFRKVWGVKVPKDWGKLTVCMYSDRKEFAQVSGGRGGVLAYYRFVAPRELDFYHDRKDIPLTVSCLFHEANHYLTDLMDERYQYPHWINEGMAEYYGASVWDPVAKTMRIGGIQEGRLAELKADMEKGVRWKVADLIGKDESAYEHYYWGWSFIHFMMSTPAYEKKFRQYFVDLARSKEVQRTVGAFNFTTSSGAENLRHFARRVGDPAAIEKEWHAYIEKLEPAGVRGYELAGFQAYQQGKWKFRATRLLKQAIDGGSRNPQTYVTYAYCLARRQDLEGALAALEQALAFDPLDADVIAEKGYMVHAMGREEEGRKLVELAREINPEGTYMTLEIAEALRKAAEKAGDGE